MSFEQTINEIFAIARRDTKQTYRNLHKRLAEAAQKLDGSSVPSEPLVVAVAEVMQAAIALFAHTTPYLTDQDRSALLSRWFADRARRQTAAPTVNPLIAAGVRTAVSKPVTVPQITKRLPKVHVLIRKHPSRLPQPLGERRVFRMQQVPGTNKIQVGIGENGKQGWVLDLSLPTPVFLTFRVDGKKQPQTLQQAWAFWQKHST